MKPETNKDQIKINTTGLEKATPFTIAKLIEYEYNSVMSRQVMKKDPGSVNVMAFDKDKGLRENSSPFDTFVQVIDGVAEIVIDNKSNVLNTGDGIIIPAHLSSRIKPNGRCKMLITTLKNGYE